MGTMFAKLMSRITESSLMEEDLPVRYCFLMLLAVADPQGYAIGTDVALARRMNMPLGDFKRCVAELMKSDPDSNSKEHDGKRVIESDCERGYYVVNYVKYRDTRDEEHRREYMREYMRKRRSGNNVGDVKGRKQRKPKLAKEKAEAKGKEKEEVDKMPSAHADFIALWTLEYPKHHDGAEYVFQGGKDGSAVKLILQNSKRNLEELGRLFVAAWKNSSGFHCSAAASISGFNSKINDIINELNAKRKPPVASGASRNVGHNVGLDYSQRPARKVANGAEGSEGAGHEQL